MSLRRSALNTTGILLLALAVFYTSRFWPTQLPLLPTAQDAATAALPDYSITNFHAVDLDETGRIRYELTAESLVHYPQPPRATLVMPEVVFFRHVRDPDSPVAEPWQLTALAGELAEDGNRMELVGDVRVVRAGTDGSEGMAMETGRLTVLGNEEVAVTDDAVILRSALASLSGVGMRVDLRKGQMHLQSRVRGHYDPR